MVEGKGGILSVTLDGANRHDAKMLAATVADMIVGRPDPEEGPQNLCLDKGYDNPSGENAALEAGYVTHIRRIGEEKFDARKKEASGAALGCGACRGVAQRLPGDSGAMEQKVVELSGANPTGDRLALVSPRGTTWAANYSRECFEIVS
jgi:hypothetical protein